MSTPFKVSDTLTPEHRLRWAHLREDDRIAFAPADRSKMRGAVLTKEAMIAHFCNLASEWATVLVYYPQPEGPGEYIAGRIGFPDFERMALPFHAGRDTKGERPRYPARRAVELRTGNDEGRFQFTVSLEGRQSKGGEDIWYLSLPRNQVYTEVRVTRRLEVTGWFLRPARATGWQGPPRAPLRDVSCGGLSLDLPNNLFSRQLTGAMISGTLSGQGRSKLSLPVRLKIRAVRDARSDPRRLIAGGAFSNIGLENYARIASALRTLTR